MRRVVLAVLLGLLFVPAAQAQDPATDTLIGGKRVAESLRIASEFWGEKPHCTAVRVYRTSPERLRAAVGRTSAAATDKPLLNAPQKECPIWVAEPFLANNYNSRIEFCSMIVHEYGHILHRDHDDIPNSIMSVTTRDWEVYACYRRFLPRGKGREWRSMHPARAWALRP